MATLYRIYDLADLSTPVATVNGTTWEAPALGPNETREYLIRAYDTETGLEDQNIDAVVRIVSDASGDDVSDAPDPPKAIWVAATSPTELEVKWSWAFTLDWRVPTHFDIYIQSGASIDYGLSPTGTVAFSRAVACYQFNASGLTASTAYKVAVRARNATGDDRSDNPKSVTTPATSSTTPDSVVGSVSWVQS